MSLVAATKRVKQPVGESRQQCPICESPHLEYEFVVEKSPVCGCQDCGLLFLNPQPARSFPSDDGMSALASEVLTDLYRANAVERMQQLISYVRLREGRLLLIGADAYLSAEAEQLGFDVFAVSPEELESAPETSLPHRMAACVLFCSLERMREPLSALRKLRTLLLPNAALMVVAPAIDSRAARLFRNSWWEFNRTNLYYFSADSLQCLLIKAGFGDPVITPDRSFVSLNYLRQKLRENTRALRRHRWLRRATSATPLLRNKAFRLFHSRHRVLVRVKEHSETPVLSVIVPVFNEAATCAELLDQLLAKNIEGVKLEVIIVESNSTDGSRDLVLQYQDHPRVKLILEDRPRGKGHAVRAGLKAATGTVVLFQDADLEYDINDYDALIAPILNFQNNFVLGSRHSKTNSSWKIRAFSDEPALAAFFNLGHLLFLTLFNTLYAQRLSDPFTMFKVFRRECLYGLSFECNRFDFDYEIVIKLLRKGYRPLELPVNYQSRSMAEGKKVTVFRDPITWVRALFKFRKSPLYDSAQV
jgi:hypothetical protein